MVDQHDTSSVSHLTSVISVCLGEHLALKDNKSPVSTGPRDAHQRVAVFQVILNSSSRGCLEELFKLRFQQHWRWSCPSNCMISGQPNIGIAPALSHLLPFRVQRLDKARSGK